VRPARGICQGPGDPGDSRRNSRSRAAPGAPPDDAEDGDISEPDVVSEVDLDRKAAAGRGDSIRHGVHRSETD
jgi:hypothetical protein